MTKPVQIINNYWLKETLLNGNPILDKFYKEDLIRMINILKDENQKYKEVINKAINYIDEYRDYQDVHKQVGIDKYEDVREDILFEENIEELLEILKEVEHE